MKTICYCDTPFEAHVIKGLLESEEIPCHVINENIQTLIPLSSVIQGMSSQVVVDERDIHRAINILKDNKSAHLADITNPHSEQLVCSECGSTEITYGFWGSKKTITKITSALMLPFLALSGNMIGNIRNNYYCKKCGNQFKL